MLIAPIRPAPARLYAVTGARGLEAVRPVREASRVGDAESRRIAVDDPAPAAVLHWSDTAALLARGRQPASPRAPIGHEGERAEPGAGGDAEAPPSGVDIHDPSQPTPEEREKIEALRQRDREVRAHEQAHKSAGGAHAGSIRFQYTTGPDGRRYAASGAVSIDVAPVPGDPEATLRKMEVVRRAANAPAEPSAADRQVAARAASVAQRARAELATERYTQTQKLTRSARAAKADTRDGAPGVSRPNDVTGPRQAPARLDVHT